MTLIAVTVAVLLVLLVGALLGGFTSRRTDKLRQVDPQMAQRVDEARAFRR